MQPTDALLIGAAAAFALAMLAVVEMRHARARRGAPIAPIAPIAPFAPLAPAAAIARPVAPPPPSPPKPPPPPPREARVLAAVAAPPVKPPPPSPRRARGTSDPTRKVRKVPGNASVIARAELDAIIATLGPVDATDDDTVVEDAAFLDEVDTVVRPRFARGTPPPPLPRRGRGGQRTARSSSAIASPQYTASRCR